MCLGGYNWYECVHDAQFSDRRYQATALDAAGHLIILGGQANGVGLNDVYRSDISFTANNSAAVASACNNAVIPTCGIGFNCHPSLPGFVRFANGSVTCPALQLCRQNATIDFDQLTPAANWAARDNHNIEYIPQTKTFILSGDNGGVDGSNDVWSSSNAVTWSLIAGITPSGFPAPTNSATSFSVVRSAGYTINSRTGRLYHISGYDIKATGSVCTNATWTSTDGRTWTNLYNPTISPHWAPRMTSNVVVTSAGLIIVAGGRQCVLNIGFYDVWASTDGVRWTQQTSSWPVSGPRNALLLTYYSTQLTTDILVHMGGWDGATDHNDVWQSTTNGVSWQLLTRSAGWAQRDDFNGEATSDGLLVIAGGKTVAGGGREILWNDVYAHCRR